MPPDNASSDDGGGGVTALAAHSWGPKRDPLYVVVPITVIYAIIFLSGIVGNVSTCVVIARNKHMHTATNYYLFSLAVSDLLLLVSGLPQELYSIWSRYPYVFGEAFCVIQGFAAETSANATVLTITAFTVERYVAICHPFQAHAVSKLSRAVKLVLAIWVLALCLAVPQAMSFGVVVEMLPDGRVTNPEHKTCMVKSFIIPYAFEISTGLFFVAPMTLITVLYVLIWQQLRRSSLLARRDASGSVRLKTSRQTQQPLDQQAVPDGRKNYAKSAQSKATRHVVKMLVAVVVAFFICWAPFHAQRLLAVYASEPDSSSFVRLLYHTLTYLSGVLYYLSTTINPLLYHIMSYKFREAFKDTLARYLGRPRTRGGRWHCYSVLSARSSNTSSDLSRRPLVVSFRRPPPPLSCRRTDSATKFNFSPIYNNYFLDYERDSLASTMFTSVVSDSSRSLLKGDRATREGSALPEISGDDRKDSELKEELSKVANRKYCARIEDIEIFQEQRCKIQRPYKSGAVSTDSSSVGRKSEGKRSKIREKLPRSEPESEGNSGSDADCRLVISRSHTVPNFNSSDKDVTENQLQDRALVMEIAKNNLRDSFEALNRRGFKLICYRCKNEIRDEFYEISSSSQQRGEVEHVPALQEEEVEVVADPQLRKDDLVPGLCNGVISVAVIRSQSCCAAMTDESMLMAVQLRSNLATFSSAPLINT